MSKQLTLTAIIKRGQIFTWTVERPLSPIPLSEIEGILADDEPDPDHTSEAQPVPKPPA